MGREVRRVPADWQHPKNDQGFYIPLCEAFPYFDEEIAEGLRDGWLTDEPPNYGLDVMPDWPEEDRTHWQMYENVSEGTPISPVCESKEDLARWLADNHANAGAGATASYEAWLATIEAGGAPSFVMTISAEGRSLRSGVEATPRGA